MRHAFLTVFFLGICLLFSGGFLGAVEVEILGGFNFLTFDPDSINHYGRQNFEPDEDNLDENGVPVLVPVDVNLKETKFEPYQYIFGGVKIKTEITENVTFGINLIRDYIYHNNLEILLGGKSEFFSFQVGPFAGITDDAFKGKDNNPDPFFGLVGGIDLMYPGIVFLEFTGSKTINKEIDIGSAHERETVSGKIGFWLPNAIPSAGASYKCFRKDGEVIICDSLERYQLSVDFYSKNYPITFRIDSGYQFLKREYTGVETIKDNSIEDEPIEIKKTRVDADELHMIFAGFEFNWQITNTGKFRIGAEMPVYFFDGKSRINKEKADNPILEPSLYKMAKVNIGFIHSRNN